MKGIPALVLGAVLLCSGTVADSAAGGASPVQVGPVLAPKEHRRGEEQTFLTYPEWFLVFSPAEYAQFVPTHTPDEFPFWGHIRQFWQGYAAVTHETRARGNPTNAGYHVMILVIGISTTVEYAVRSAYETIVGRIAALSASRPTAEDRYAATAAQEYVDFIRERPWYEFDFVARLRGLWTQVPWSDGGLLRKVERRYALTSEYGIKAVYGWLIGLATHSAYERPLFSTSVVVKTWPVCADAPAGVSVLSATAEGGALLLLPRYEAFMAPARALARCGAQFREIAGNRSDILISVVEPVNAPGLPEVRVVMRQPILTRPGSQRTVALVPVRGLGDVLRTMDQRTGQLEHVFDY